MPEDRKVKLVVKSHTCASIGELSSWKSIDCRSTVNDVGNAVLVARYGASDANDAILDALNTADIILEVYIKPPGQLTFLDEPVWAGFLRDRKLSQEGPVMVGTYTFKDYNHLLARRVVEPPPGASHDEDYDTVANTMRNMVRRHCAEDADDDRQFPGLSVESNDDLTPGTLYFGDETSLIFGGNAPNWVRANALHDYDGNLYVGLETRRDSGEAAHIYRMATDGVWTDVFDGENVLYDYRITAIHCFAEFDGKLWAGCSREWEDQPAILIWTIDGVTWTRGHIFEEPRVLSLLAFDTDGLFYAGMDSDNVGPGETPVGIYRSVDGAVWTAAFTPYVNAAYQYRHYWCNALYEWNGVLYAGFNWRCRFILGAGAGASLSFCSGWEVNADRAATIWSSADGTTWDRVWTGQSPGTEWGDGVLSFGLHSGHLYAGTGRSRYWGYYGSLGDVIFTNGAGGILRTGDGATWEWVFGGHLSSDQRCDGVTSFLSTMDHDGNFVLWAATGSYQDTINKATIWYMTTTIDDAGDTTYRWTKLVSLDTIPYEYILDLCEYGGLRYASTGSYMGTAGYRSYPGMPDHGDVWRIALGQGDDATAGYLGRYDPVLSKLQELAEHSGIHDFGIVGYDSFLYCTDDVQNFQLQVRTPQWGTDNRWDEDTGEGVTFQMERRNMTDPQYSEIRGARPNMLFLLGPSSGEDREVSRYFDNTSISESPWNRIEGSIDAQSMFAGVSRDSKGQADLAALGPYTDLEFRILETDENYYGGPW